MIIEQRATKAEGDRKPVEMHAETHTPAKGVVENIGFFLIESLCHGVQRWVKVGRFRVKVGRFRVKVGRFKVTKL